jgi:putative ABC transport system permease protein
VDDASVRADSAAARAEGHPFVSDAQLMLPSEPQRRLSRVATNADPEVVSRSYRQVIGQTLLHGRWFDASDDARERPVAVLNARLAHALWSDADPVGKTIRLGARGSVITIIGVASDVKTLTVDEQSPGALPVVYLNDMQAMGWSDEVFVRTITGASTHKGIFAPAVRAIDPERPAPTPSLLEDESTDIATTLRPESRLLGGFAIVAFALALIGIYGVTAYAVAQRTREVGIRVALGARASDVVLGMMRDGTRYVIVGLGIGVTLALGVSRVVESQLEGVAAFDPAVYLLATIGCGAVALLACYIPSRRAARVDPIVALRSE